MLKYTLKSQPHKPIEVHPNLMDIATNEDLALSRGDTAIVQTGVTITLPQGVGGVIVAAEGAYDRGYELTNHMEIVTGTVTITPRITSISKDVLTVFEGDYLFRVLVIPTNSHNEKQEKK